MCSITDNNGILEVPNDPEFEPDSKGYGAHCFYKMKEYSDQIAQINIDTNQVDIYKEILMKSIRIALHMKKIEIKNTDFVTICTDTHSETCLPYWAAVFSGIKFANIDPTLAKSDMKYLINLVKPKLIFCIPECVENLESVIEELKLETKLIIFGDTRKHISFKELLNPIEGEDEYKPNVVRDIFDTACVFFSSGTTGLPKGVCCNHYGLLYTINLFKYTFNMKTVLYSTSPYWITYSLILSGALISGGKRVLFKTFVANSILKLVQDYKITYIFLPPTLLFAISQQEVSGDTYDTSSLYSMMIGGGRLETGILKKLKILFPHTFMNYSYGLTDITGYFSGFDTKKYPEIINRKIDSSGKMTSGSMCKIVDIETNKILGKNKRGELLIKTKRVMNEYYNDLQKTAEVFDKDGFLHTGDVVYYDDDYYFYIVDRIKEMFKYKSWHIYPTELESILLKHPAVKEALVVGYPHEEDGDHPMAAIVLKDTNILEQEILQYFNEQVDDRKKLRAGLKFLTNLPKTVTGKYNRLKLRTMLIRNEI